MSNTENHIILFDGICNLCNGIVKFIIKKDSKEKFRFAALQSEKGKTLLKKYDITANSSDTFVLLIGDNYYLKSTAALLVLKELGGIWKLAYLFIYLPKPLRDSVYNLIAKWRYKIFGKQNSCMVPTANIRKRFL